MRNVFAAEVTTDTAEAFETGTPFHLIPAGEMSRNTESDKAVVYFDNVAFYTSGAEGATEVSITGAALRPADVAKITGKYVDPATGAVFDTGEYVEKYFALGGETENTDGTKEYFWFAKGTFAMPEQADKTKDDSTDTNGMTLGYSAVQTKHLFTVDGEQKPIKRTVIDTETTELIAEQGWTAQVVTPDNIATVAKKKTTT
jgi:phi13 family phage major tail protein